MRSKDMIKQELNVKIADALKGNDQDALSAIMADFAVNLQNEILEDAAAFRATGDEAIKAARGIRVLTSEEKEYYNKFIQAAKSPNPRSAITDILTALPETVIDAVMDEAMEEFPILDAIDFRNTKALTQMVVNAKGVQTATWGALNTAIKTELEGAISVIEITHCKLIAYMAISQDMLAEGPEWCDAYIRAVLAEAYGSGLSAAVISGTGLDQPIGMLKDLTSYDTTTGYADKTATAITDLKPATFGKIAASVAKGPNDRTRKVPELLMVVNPTDYFNLVMPATTYLNSVGNYVQHVFPYATKVVQDINVPTGKAIFGLAKRYILCAGTAGKSGKIEYSDEFQFIEDLRTYKIKGFANGQPLDNNAFYVADISGLESLS